MNQSYTSTYERSYALVIGIDTYQTLQPLTTAVHDAEGIADILKDRLGFEVTLLRDKEATRDGILEHIQSLTETGPNDRVLIYFAGHGLTRTTTTGAKVGLLVPYGVRHGEYERAIEMDYLVDRSKFIPAKHIMYVMDACFSGLAVTRSAGAGSRLLEDLMTRRSVQAIAAGQEDQLVSDTFGSGGHSIFTGSLLNQLDQRTRMLTGNELGLQLQRHVAQVSHSRQTPHYGHLVGSQGGDFVFWADEVVVELPPEITDAIENPQAWMRLGVINELARMLDGDDPDMSVLAIRALESMAQNDDSISVRDSAQAALMGTSSALAVTTSATIIAHDTFEEFKQHFLYQWSTRRKVLVAAAFLWPLLLAVLHLSGSFLLNALIALGNALLMSAITAYFRWTRRRVVFVGLALLWSLVWILCSGRNIVAWHLWSWASVLGVLTIAENRRRKQSSQRRVALFVAALLLPLIGWLVLNLVEFGFASLVVSVLEFGSSLTGYVPGQAFPELPYILRDSLWGISQACGYSAALGFVVAVLTTFVFRKRKQQNT